VLATFDTLIWCAGGDSVGLSMLKTLRILRIIRVVRFFRQLSTLVAMVADSVKSLAWAILLFAMILYMFSVALCGLAHVWLKDQVDARDSDWLDLLPEHPSDTVRAVREHFGGLGQTSYTLCMVTLSGMNWGTLTDKIAPMNDLVFISLISLWIVFTVIAMLNVFTGVFVDNVLHSRKMMRQNQIQEASENQRMYIDQVCEVFIALDKNNDGAVSLAEFKHILEEPEIEAYFKMLGFESFETKQLFEAFDVEQEEQLTFENFLRGCERLKGPAKGSDMQVLLSQQRVLQQQVEILIDALNLRPEAMRKNRQMSMRSQSKPPSESAKRAST